MPTILTHALVPLAAGIALGPSRIAKPVLVTGMVLAMLPDADVIGFKLGIDYADQFGHRGASHALLVAAVVAALVTMLMRQWIMQGSQNRSSELVEERFTDKRPSTGSRLRYSGPLFVFAFLFASMASHGILDAFTSGGLGPALLWPFSDARYFAPVTPIRVSPIGAGFFSARGVVVILSEALWVCDPLALTALAGRFWLRQKA